MPKVLVIDDEQGIRRLARAGLTARGYEVIEAHQGDSAISQAQQRHPDLMLLDVVMPGSLDGVQVYHRLKSKTSTRGIRVIFVTATEPGGSVTAQNLPMGERCAVVGKPFDLDRLLQEIHRLLAD